MQSSALGPDRWTEAAAKRSAIVAFNEEQVRAVAANPGACRPGDPAVEAAALAMAEQTLALHFCRQNLGMKALGREPQTGLMMIMGRPVMVVFVLIRGQSHRPFCFPSWEPQ